MHELGHSVVISHYDRKVKSAGFLIYFGSPAFFVEATDSLMLERRQRILQASGGPFTELVDRRASAAIAVFVFPDGPLANLLYKFALLNYIVIFLNLVPLLELDGYWILSDLIQVPDLRPRSLQFIQHDLWHKARAREKLTPQEWGSGRLRGRRDRVHDLLLLHGVLLLGSDLRGADHQPLGRRHGSRILLVLLWSVPRGTR